MSRIKLADTEEESFLKYKELLRQLNDLKCWREISTVANCTDMYLETRRGIAKLVFDQRSIYLCLTWIRWPSKFSNLVETNIPLADTLGKSSDLVKIDVPFEDILEDCTKAQQEELLFHLNLFS